MNLRLEQQSKERLLSFADAASVFLVLAGGYFWCVSLLSADGQSTYTTNALISAIALLGCGAFMLALGFSSQNLPSYFRRAVLIFTALALAAEVLFVYKALTPGLALPISNEAIAMSLAVLVCLSCICLAVGEKPRGARQRAVMAIRDLPLLVLPALPLSNILFSNREYFHLSDGLLLCGQLLAPTACALILGFILLGPLYPTRNFASPIIASSVFALIAMPTLTSVTRDPTSPNFALHCILWLGSVLLTVAAYLFNRRALEGSLIVIFLISALFNLRPDVSKTPAVSNGSSSAAALDKELTSRPVSRPDIFFLVYDAYANERMMQRYGIDISSQIDFLRERGFSLYPDIYTVAVRSAPSISRVLDMDAAPKTKIGGPLTVYRALKRWGYHTFLAGLEWSRKSHSKWGPDDTVPATIQPVGGAAILASIRRGFLDEREIFLRARSTPALWERQKRAILSGRDSSAQPIFMYAHDLSSHHFRTPKRACQENAIPKYNKMITAANEEMRADVEAILASNRDAVIIIAGDHGPDVLSCGSYEIDNPPKNMMTGDRLADVYGCFLAIKSPAGLSLNAADIQILQDIFFAVFAEMLKKPEILKYRLNQQILTPTHKGVPSNGISNGIITFGPAEGKKLFESF